MRADKIWSDEAAVNDFLLHGEVGHLTTIDSEGWPHTVPVDYVWHDRAIFFHSGSGAKMSHLALNPKAAFAVTEALETLTSEVTSDNNPCHDNHLGRSVLIHGLAREIVDPAEKMEILNIIISKYDPKAIRLGENLPGSESVTTQPAFKACRVVKIEVTKLTACRLLLVNKPAEYRTALADYFEARGLAVDSARDLKTSILLRSVTPASGG